ncbi:hypothetical protein [Arthrobacter sp. HS15c]|uniref:hypothetical protein n=1 Tax=Arthrobacter sp. HS15c TaxID=3230279 RepID=UPI0034652598
MPIIKNVSPLGELDVPLLGCFLGYREEIEVSDEVAERLLPQAENYAPVDDEAKAILAKIYADPEADEPTEGEGETDEPADEPAADPKPPTKRTRRQSGS